MCLGVSHIDLRYEAVTNQSLAWITYLFDTPKVWASVKTQMPLNRKWRSMDLFGSRESLNKLPFLNHGNKDKDHGNKDKDHGNKVKDSKEGHLKHEHPAELRPPKGNSKNRLYLRRLSSLTPGSDSNAGSSRNVEPADPASLVQRCVIIQRDEKGYGFTVSGDNPVFVASVKADGAASKAGVQQGDRIVKVNGTLVTSRNHLDVVKLIKSGSYVALTLLGKPHPSGAINTPSIIASSKRDSVTGQVVTAPQPVDPEKDKELWNQKVVMTRTMYETAKEDYNMLQRQYVVKPTDKLYNQLLEKERTYRALEQQLKQLTGEDKLHSAITSISHPPVPEHGSIDNTWLHRSGSPSNIRHSKQSSVPSLASSSAGESSLAEMRGVQVARSKSDVATRNKKSSVFYVDNQGFKDSEAKKRYFHLKRASSVPTTTSDFGSVYDSPQTSPSVSPTPNGQESVDTMSTDIITIDDEEVHSEDEQLLAAVSPWVGGRPTTPIGTKITGPEMNNPGPFADIKLLESKPAHLAVFLNYLFHNLDPSPVLFHLISDQYSRCTANSKELRKYAYEIYSTFIAQNAPLSVCDDDILISQMDNILNISATKTDNDIALRTMFQPVRQNVQNEISELLSDFRSKKDLGMLNFYGYGKLQDNMDKNMEIKAAEETLIPVISSLGVEDNVRVEKDQAIVWAFATFLRSWVGTKSSHPTLERVQTFMMKEKKSIRIPMRSSKAKEVKGHQFILQHFFVTTNCNCCGGLLWGVGFQGYQCQTCKMPLHKQCVENITEPCGGKLKRKDRPLSKPPPPKKPTIGQGSIETQRPLSEIPHITQPYPKDPEDLANILSLIAGLPKHSVGSIVRRYESSPTGPGPGIPGLSVSTSGSKLDSEGERKSGTDLSRSGSLNNKPEQKGDGRRTKSDVDINPEMFKALHQSQSSSASSSNRSIESPSNSTDTIIDTNKMPYDSDLDVDTELPPLKSVLGEEVCRKLKPKEKKRQEVINELFYTERTHLRNLKILDHLFNRPMLTDVAMSDLARALFPSMDELINCHASLNADMKERVKSNPVVKDVGDLLLKRFDGQSGEWFRKICAEYCRNQAFALDFLKKQTRKEPKLQQFLNDAESNPLCRRLQLKDLVPSQMQRLTKYPLLIDNLLKHTQASSEEHKRLERALERCKHILGYVNMAVKECENYHKLKDIQKRLDRRSIESSTDPNLADVKNLDLTTHKLIFDGPLTWKLRSHRTVDLHVLLFDDKLVLLQKQDEKFILKCQNTNVQAAKDDHKYTHSPVLRLQNLLARSLATDKKSFFVVNISEVRAQMYEFTAATSEMRVQWCKLINEKAEELKKNNNIPGPRTSTVMPQSPLESVTLERTSSTSKESDTNSPVQEISAGDEEDNEEDVIDGRLESLDTHQDELVQSDELIQPDELRVTNPVTSVPVPVRSSSLSDLILQNARKIESCFQEREHLLKLMLSPSHNQQNPADVPPRSTEEENEEVDKEELIQLFDKAFEISRRFLHHLLASGPPSNQRQTMDQESPSSPSRPLSTISQGESSASEAESSSSGVSSQQQTIQPPAQIVQQQSLSVPVPMEQLKEMALEMNTILAQLMSAMNSGSEERHRLRNELQLAQQKLDALKQLQRSISGSSPPSRSSPAFGSSSNIPVASGKTSNEVQEEHVSKSAAHSSQAFQTVIPDEDLVHHGIQQETHLEESVEALHLSTGSAEAVQAIATEKLDDFRIDDDEGSSNEVSVADLPLPDIVNIPDSDQHDTFHHNEADLDDSESESDDNDTLTSKNSIQDFPSLSTTVEDVAGEEMEGVNMVDSIQHRESDGSSNVDPQ
ncbi:rho guanine nucleotide exchange factor 11-like isoform X9 [Biomphalaria glabrata]|uniref:Rho guanine nucleotide exchange factor 11-like isoform X9 n=1 Tax=Biomphalaria glabrata TaxID=6526 RepID=A0A9W2YTB5_BIOGL|nr:rho guanine nucleotide exchange factor 11-like isoform X9 [Biomphalaria glabrata]